MKTALLLLVVLAVAAPAQALQCHVCSSATNCEKPQTCPAGSRYCRTLYTVDPLRGNLVTKECVQSCVDNSSQQGQLGSGTTTTACCERDLCNSQKLPHHSAAHALLSSSALPLALALGLLTFLLAPHL